MRKLIIAIIMLIFALTLSGCKKEVEIKQEFVDAVIIERNSSPASTVIINNGHTITPITTPADYWIMISYKGQTYAVHGSDVYDYAADKVGKTVKALASVTKYDDGSEKIKILSIDMEDS